MQPDALISQDPALLHQVDVLSGLERPGGYILINTNKGFAELGLGEFVKGMRMNRLVSLPATEAYNLVKEAVSAKEANHA